MPRKPISFELDFMIKDIFPRFAVKQFDDVSFNIKPKNQGLDYNTTGMIGKIFVGVNNDMFMQTTGITVSNNNINILLDKNMLQKSGRAYAEVELTDNAGTITSSSFIFDIDPKIGEGGQIPGEYEGFVEKYERLISEFKSQVNSCVNNANTLVNKTINNCNINVDNKLNTVDGLINTKISDFEKRFNRLTVSQQQSTEVIAAREDFKGNVYDSLKERIDYTDKILRESTVSTVTTESDFTTVEATSNGYFEDVKLEGKTLVNLCDKVAYKAGSSQSSIVSDADNNCTNVTITSEGSSVLCYEINSQLKPSTTYTAICQVKTDYWHPIEEYKVAISFRNVSGTDFGLSLKTFATADFSSQFVSVITTIQTDANSEVNNLVIGNHGNQGVGKTLSVKNVILLEGDHTQNPPSYFEGLKSVGQSASEDGVDEIVVSSVKGDGNLIPTFDGFIVENNFNNSVVITDTKIEGIPSVGGFKVIKLTYLNEGSYTCSTDGHAGINARVRILNTDRSIKIANVVNQSFTIDKPGLYIVSIENNGNTETSFSIEGLYIYKYGKQKPDLYSYQSDKKRLLYYNNETQTWEKPILRQWDSIEKHSNGKYYYHQRSREAVLNGSENWELQSDTAWETDTHISFYYYIANMRRNFWGTESVSICDRFNTITANNSNYTDSNEFSSTDSYKFNVKILKSKLTTQDVQGFKQWLQANNVTVVYQLAEEKVYECTNIDLITYANETNYIVESGAIVPKTTLKVHNNISNVVSLLQKKVSILESNITSYMITQNRLMLASRYNADTVSFKVDVATLRNSFEYDNDLYELILNNILVGKDNYNREYIENLIIFYWMDFVISDEMHSTLFEIIEEQHNPKVIEEEAPIE